MDKQTLEIGLAQVAPVWLNHREMIEKALIVKALCYAENSANENCKIVVLGCASSVGAMRFEKLRAVQIV